MQEPYISVIVPARNEGGRLADAIRSILDGRSCLFPLECIVVDDASEDGCCDCLPDLFTWPRDRVHMRVERLNQWSGIPYARNRGAFAARSRILFITDANVRFHAGWDLPIRRNLHSNRALCATIADMASAFRGYGCVLDMPSMGVHWLRDPHRYAGFVPIAPCAGTVIPTDLFRQIGGYDTGMPVYGAAEPEFSVRLWLSGAEIVTVPDLVVAHRFRPEAERSEFLDRIHPIQVHNYLRFGTLYLRDADLLQTLRYYAIQSPALIAEALQRLEVGDVWARRECLRDRLPFNFEWYVRRFHLRHSAGQSTL